MRDESPHTTDDASSLHIEVTMLTSPSETTGIQSAPARPRKRLWQAAIIGGVIVIALVVIFSGYLPLRTPLTGWALPQPTATSTPEPASALLGSVPSDCPPGNPIENFSSSYSSGVNLGGLPIWLVGFDGPRATLRYTSGAPQTPYGWSHKIILVAAPDVTQQIVLAASGMGNAQSSVWFSTNGWEQATSPLILTPAQTSPQPDGWRAWVMNVFVRSSGCYFLSVQLGASQAGTYFAVGM